MNILASKVLEQTDAALEITACLAQDVSSILRRDNLKFVLVLADVRSNLFTLLMQFRQVAGHIDEGDGAKLVFADKPGILLTSLPVSERNEVYGTVVLYKAHKGHSTKEIHANRCAHNALMFNC